MAVGKEDSGVRKDSVVDAGNGHHDGRVGSVVNRSLHSLRVIRLAVPNSAKIHNIEEPPPIGKEACATKARVGSVVMAVSGSVVMAVSGSKVE